LQPAIHSTSADLVAFRLQFRRLEGRVVARGRIAVVLMLTLFTLIGVGIRASQYAATAPHPQGSRIGAAQTAGREEPPTDVLGNEISEAVATYKLDSTGSLYEEHSPQTELPRLGSPKS
jgi:hypothetical protein